MLCPAEECYVLRQWSVSNFKSFLGSNSFSLNRLTLVCGANSSGKSSLLQSILLMKQTVQHGTPSRSVALNGPLVRLGAFSDIQNFSSKMANPSSAIGFGWNISLNKIPEDGAAWTSRYYTNFIQEVKTSFEIDNVVRLGDIENLELQPNLKESCVAANYCDEALVNHEFKFEIKRSVRRGRKINFDSTTLGEGVDPLRLIVKALDDETRAKIQETWQDMSIIGAATTHFMPGGIIARFDRSRDVTRRLCREIEMARAGYRRRVPLPNIDLSPPVISYLASCIRSGSSADERSAEIGQTLLGVNDEKLLSFSEFFQRLISLPPSTRAALQRAMFKEPKKLEFLLYHSLGRNLQLTRRRIDLMTEVAGLNSDFFRFGVHYLGPLRDEPRPLYPLQAMSSPTDVGPKGELTAAVLHLNSLRIVDYITPTGFLPDKADLIRQKARLVDAVGAWLQYLGVAVDVETSEKGKFGHELRVRTSKNMEFQDLTNVGVGVSQVLPIIVTCLLAPKGSTIILEQPELHLHPAVQARLADFFISMVALDKQCIIETHGEHLVDRLRLRIVCDDSDLLLDSTKIFFFSQQTGVTTYREIAVNEYGAIEDWPDDFFDQSQKQSEQITMKALERRRLNRERGKGSPG